MLVFSLKLCLNQTISIPESLNSHKEGKFVRFFPPNNIKNVNFHNKHKKRQSKLHVLNDSTISKSANLSLILLERC